MPRRTRELPALLASPRAAFIRRAGQPGIMRPGSAVAQVTRQDLVHQHVRCLDTNADDLCQPPDHRVGALLGVLLEPFQARGFDLSDLADPTRVKGIR